MVTQRISLESYLAKEAQEMAELCTACGKCLEVCPMVDYTPYKDQDRSFLMTLARGVLKEGTYSEEAKVVAGACTGSADCLDVCPEGINPMRMLRLVQTNAERLEWEAGGGRPEGVAEFMKAYSLIDVVRSLQMRDSEINWYQGSLPDGVKADLVLMLGCNIMRTPHLAHAGLEVIRRIGFNVQAIGGRAYCCGEPGFGTDNRMSEKTTLGTFRAFDMFSPDQVLTWCPSCFHHFNDFTNDIIDYDYEMGHTTHFLADNVERVQAAIVNPVRKRVAVHEHGALGSNAPIVPDVKKVLGVIPGLELVEIEQFPYGYQCGPVLGANPAAKRAAQRKVCEEAVEAKVDMLVTIHQSCEREFCIAEKYYPFEAKAFIILLAEAMGLEYENRYKKFKMTGDVDQIMWEARDYAADSGYSAKRIKAAIQSEWGRPDELSPESLSGQGNSTSALEVE